jgi:hypothetical protein
MNPFTQPLLAAALRTAVAAMLLDMLARGVFGPARPVKPIDDPPAVQCPTCPAGQQRLAEMLVAEAVEVHDLAKLTPAQAAELDGKRALFRVIITSASGDTGKGKDRREYYEVLPDDDPQGMLWLVWGRGA